MNGIKDYVTIPRITGVLYATLALYLAVTTVNVQRFSDRIFFGFVAVVIGGVSIVIWKAIRTQNLILFARALIPIVVIFFVTFATFLINVFSGRPAAFGGSLFLGGLMMTQIAWVINGGKW